MTGRPFLFVTGRLRPRRMTLGEFRGAVRELTDTINRAADRATDAAAYRPSLFGPRADQAREIRPIAVDFTPPAALRSRGGRP